MDDQEQLQLEELLSKFGDSLADKIAVAVVRASKSTEPSSSSGQATNSGSRSGSSTLDDAPPMSFKPFGKNSIWEEITDPQKTAARAARHEARHQGAGGFVPAFYGGVPTWQQAATLTADTMGKYSTKAGALKSALDFTSSGAMDEMPLTVRGAMGVFGGIETGLGIAKNAAEYAEENALMIDTIRHHFSAAKQKSDSLTARGMQLGTPPSEGFGSALGPIRAPFINPSARTAIGSSIDSGISATLSPGLNIKEDQQIKTVLADLGFYDGDQDTKKLLGSADGSTRSGLRELFQQDPRAFSQKAEMTLKATRYGTTDVESMVEMMKGVGDAAKAANVGLEDMLAQMDAAGEAAKDAGGKYKEGAEAAMEFSQASGLPAEVQTKALGSPLMQGLISGQTGLPPYLQGAIAAGPKNELFMQSMEQVIDMVPDQPVTPEMKANGVSAADAKAAMIREMLGVDIDPAHIKRFFNPNFRNNFKEYTQTDTALDSFDPKGSAKKFRKSTKQMKEAIAGAKKLDGSSLYSEEDIESVKNAEASARGIARGGERTEEEEDELVKFIEDAKDIKRDDGGLFGGGESKEEFIQKHFLTNRRLKAGYIAQKTRDEANKVHEKEGKRLVDKYNNEIKATGGSSSNVTVTLDLTSEAKKLVKQSDVKKVNKGKANRGGLPTVQALNSPDGATAAD